MQSKKSKTSKSTMGLKIENEMRFAKVACAEINIEFYNTVA